MITTRETKENPPSAVTGVSLLTILIIKDSERYMARCPELDLVTEMDTKEEALKAMVELIGDYAKDYRSREEIYLKSPNRAHHKPYVDRIIGCRDECRVYWVLAIRQAVMHGSPERTLCRLG